MKKQCLLLACIAALHPACADDPFAAFADLEAAAAAAQVEPANPIGQWIDNLSGSLELHGLHHFHNRTPAAPGASSKNDFLFSVLNLETWIGDDIWNVGMGGWIQIGNHRDTFRHTSLTGGHFFQDTDQEEHRYIVLDELYLMLSPGDWDLTLGKKTLHNGIATLYSPADNLTPLSGIDPIRVREMGAWQIRADYYHGKSSWTAAILPIYQPNKVPPSTSRWIIDTSGQNPETDYPAKRLNHFGYFGRYKTVYNGWDLFASMYAGPGKNIVVAQTGPSPLPGIVPPPVERRVPDVINPAAGYSTTRGGWEFHGEAMYVRTLHGEDQDYVAFTQGTTRSLDGDWVKLIGIDKIEATAAFAWEWKVSEQTARNYVQDSSDYRIGQRDLLGRLRFEFTDKIDALYETHILLRHWGYMNRVAFNWEFRKNLVWTVESGFFGGNNRSGTAGVDNLALTYGNWQRNNYVSTGLKYNF